MAQLEQWYKSLPPVTRGWMTASLATTFAVQAGLVSSFALYCNYDAVFHKLELWRLATNFLYFDRLSLNFILHMYFLVQHSSALEEGIANTSEYLYLLLIGSVGILIANFVCVLYIPQFVRYYLASSLILTVVYVWGRRNVHTTLNFFGIMRFRAPYISFVLLGLSFFLGGSISDDLLGIASGHFYFFFKDVYPRLRPGRELLKTPAFLGYLLHNMAL